MQFLQNGRVLAALLSSFEDPLDRIRAATALLLGNVTIPEAQEALVRHLRHDHSHRVRLACATSLQSSSPSPKVVDAYTAALDDTIDGVVITACIALGKQGDRRAIGPLHAKLVHPSWNVRFRACEALVNLGAVDFEVISVLETLNVQAESEEHNNFVVHVKAMPDLYDPWGLDKNEQAQTSQVVLKKARSINLDDASMD